MADIEYPGAAAPDEDIILPADVAEPPPEPAAAVPVKNAVVVPAAPPQAQPRPTATFESWATSKLGIVVNDIGVGSGVRAGKRIPGATRKAAFFNAARRLGRIPLGRVMTESQFDAAIKAAESIEVKANG